MHNCPYCSYVLLRHARQGRIYWFCSHCWQEVPNLDSVSNFVNRVLEQSSITPSHPVGSVAALGGDAMTLSPFR